MISIKDLKYLTDENIDVELLEFLREQGFDVFDIKEARLFRLSPLLQDARVCSLVRKKH
jgi:hypothetical protein